MNKFVVMAALLVVCAVGCDESQAGELTDRDGSDDQQVAQDDASEEEPTPGDESSDVDGLRQQLSEAGVNLECDESGQVSDSSLAAISDVEAFRGPLDRDGPRWVGCLYNRSDDRVERLMLSYSTVQQQGAGGGSVELQFAPLESGESGVFVSSQVQGYDRDIDGYELSSVEVSPMDGDYDLEPEYAADPFELSRPEHPVESACEDRESADAESGVVIGDAQFVATMSPDEPEFRVVGCVTNGGDEGIADNMQNSVRVAYSDDPDNYDGVQGQAQGRLELSGALEPGSSEFFISNFEVTAAEPRVVMEPVVQIRPRDWVDVESGGSKVVVDR